MRPPKSVRVSVSGTAGVEDCSIYEVYIKPAMHKHKHQAHASHFTTGFPTSGR